MPTHVDKLPKLDDTTKNRLAKLVQQRVPLVDRPFRALASQMELTEGTVIDQVGDWLDQGRLREISAILEGAAFGNDSALVAGRVPEDNIEHVASIINAHPTVTHNYRREHDYNLWFTISTPPRMDLEKTLDILAEQTGVEKYHPLRRTHTFKIGVTFDLQTCKNTTEVKDLDAPSVRTPSEREKRMYRALQTPLPAQAEPFGLLAKQAGVPAEELLEFARAELGTSIRRYVGTFQHRRIGVHGNGMTVWTVPEDQLADIGMQMARAPEVSHCYARNAIPGFPWTLYTMIHGPDPDAVRRVVLRLQEQTGADDYLILFSTHEYKKCRLRYFLPELDQWWDKHATRGAA